MAPGTCWSTYDQSSAPITGVGISIAFASPRGRAGRVERELGGVGVVHRHRVAATIDDLGRGTVGGGEPSRDRSMSASTASRAFSDTVRTVP